MTKQTRRGLKIVEQNFLNHKFDSIDDFINKNFINEDTTLIPIINSSYTTVGKNLNIMLDFGDGRVSKGLQSLEIMTRTVKGRDPANYYLFEDNINAISMVKFIENTQIENQIYILQTLGIYDLLQLAKIRVPELDTSAFALAANILKLMKNGTFRKGTLNTTALTLAKQIVVAASLYKGRL